MYLFVLVHEVKEILFLINPAGLKSHLKSCWWVFQPLYTSASILGFIFLITRKQETMSPTSEVQGYCLRWNNHHNTLVSVLQSLYHSGSFVDVTLASEGKSIQVHRLVLCACSPYFQVFSVLLNNCTFYNSFNVHRNCFFNTGINKPSYFLRMFHSPNWKHSLTICTREKLT